MQPRSEKHRDQSPHHIEVHLRDLTQLFNTIDPSPFHERDLDKDAEEFIVSWMREIPLEEPVVLTVHLSQFPAAGEPQQIIQQAVHHYFAHRAKISRLEFKRLMGQGRQNLLIGLAFLTICLLAGETLKTLSGDSTVGIVRESLTIAGWVAMWRPMEIYLYDWWPVRQRGKIYDKLSHLKIEVRKKE